MNSVTTTKNLDTPSPPGSTSKNEPPYKQICEEIRFEIRFYFYSRIPGKNLSYSDHEAVAAKIFLR